MEGADLISKVRMALSGVVRGKEEVIDLLLVGALSGGHILFEDVPGVGKSTLARAFARVFALDCGRVHCTPDLLPSDLLGLQILDPRTGELRFQKGPVFSQVFLADELNRASTRTQAALLEAMNEGVVTVDGNALPLPAPFLVLATQNPLEHFGTQPLPESQLDRFLLRLSLGYPAPEQEFQLLLDRRDRDPLSELAPLASGADLLGFQRQVQQVRVVEPVMQYLLSIIQKTRALPGVRIGASPRAGLGLLRASQARAWLEGRDWVAPDDIQFMAPHVLGHRVFFSRAGELRPVQAPDWVREVLRRAEVPV